MTNLYLATTLTTNTTTSWFYPPADIKGFGQSSEYTYQLYWAGADNTDGTITPYVTLDATLGSTNGMETAIALQTLTTTNGQMTWTGNNYNFSAVRFKLDMGSMTTLGTLAIYAGW